MTKKFNRVFLAFCAIFLFHAAVFCADSPQFRGPDRDGIFKESGLLKAWPEAGPAQLWSVEGLGKGYASVAVMDGRLYTTGMSDDNQGFAFAYDSAGKLLWKKEYGEVHKGGGFPGTRTTPTVDGNHLYLLSSMGKAICLKTDNGEKVWEVDILERFKGESNAQDNNIFFGISESPLIDGDHVIFTPGSPEATLVALNKKTGETVWTSKGLADKSAYCNPRIFENGQHRQIITMVQKNMVGIDPKNGNIIWTQAYPATYDIHAVSPVFQGNLIYVTNGYNQGGTLFEMSADGKGVTQKWKEAKLDVHHGGSILVDGRIYGAASKKDWYCLNLKTGEHLATIEKLGKGSLVYADGLIYGYMESGKVHLVNPDPNKFEVISSLEISKGNGQHWAHPVVSNGVLYIRHGDAMMAFDIKDSKS